MLNNRNINKLIDYDVSSYSSCQSNFNADSIKIHDPTNGESKWAATSSDQDQYIVLKLKKPALITAITFGKFYKLHINNVKDFKIYGYNDASDNNDMDCCNHLDNSKCVNEPESKPCTAKQKNDAKKYTYKYTNTPENPVLLFEGFTTNDTNMETFSLTLVHKNQFNLVKYIKIVPMHAWGVNLNYFIWHVKLHGIDDSAAMHKMIQHNHEIINDKCYKIVVDFLKKEMRNDVIEIFKKDKNDIDVGYITDKIKQLIKNDDFDELENFFEVLVDKNMINNDKFIYGMWKNLDGKHDNTQHTKTTSILPYTLNNDANSPIMCALNKVKKDNSQRSKNTSAKPGPRGGHGMVSYKNELYIQGGWDGVDELGDFWVFDVEKQDWKKIKNYAINRSCHKMVVIQRKRTEDEKRRELLSSQMRTNTQSKPTKNKAPGCPKCCPNTEIHCDETKTKFKNVKILPQEEGKEAEHKDKIEDYILTIGKYVTKENCAEQIDLTLYNINRDAHIRLRTHGKIDNIYDHQIAYSGKEIYIMGGRYIERGIYYYGKLYEIKEKEILELQNKESKANDLQDRIGHNLLYYEHNQTKDFFSDSTTNLDNISSINTESEYENILENIKRQKKQNLNEYLITKNNLLIVGGQKDKNFYQDISFYDLDTNTV
ncbi:Muskelin 1 [Binucleata daphniae]